MAEYQRAESALITPNLKTTSLIVAEKFGKRHDDVLKRIGSIEVPAEYRLRNFAETVVERANPSGGAPITSKAYEMTRDGFALLVMGFTKLLTIAPRVGRLCLQRQKNVVGIDLLSVTRRTTNRATHWASAVFYGRACRSTLGCAVPGDGKVNSVSSDRHRLTSMRLGFENLTPGGQHG